MQFVQVERGFIYSWDNFLFRFSYFFESFYYEDKFIIKYVLIDL